jgi:hypothetical protein
VTVVQTGEGGTSKVLLGKKGRRKKKVTSWLRPTERVYRQYLKAERRCWGEAIKRHDKSRGKKRDRWLTDGANNNLRALDKGCRVLGKV